MKEDLMDFSEEEKLRNEVKYLKARLQNIEKFKSYFFETKTDLILATEQIASLENELALSKVKKHIISPDEVADSSQGCLVGNDYVLGFVKESLLVTEYKELAASIFRTMDGLGVNVSVRITDDDKIYSCDSCDKDDAATIFNQYKDRGEFVSLDSSGLIFNYKNISLYVSNLSDINSPKNEKIKDFAMLVAMSANLRMDSLKKSIELEVLKQNMYQIFRKTHSEFESTQEKLDNQVMEISEMILELEKNVKDTLCQMEIPESYARVLTMLMHSTKSDLNILLTSSLCVDEGFLQAIIKLEEYYANKIHSVTN